MRRISIFILSVLIISSCAKEQGNASVSFQINQTDSTVNSVKFDLSVTTDAKNNISQVGIIYSQSPYQGLEFSDDGSYYYYYNPDQDAVVKEWKSGTFQLELTDLEDNAEYRYRPFAVIDGYPYYGDSSTFRTTCPGLGKGPAGGYIVYSDGSGGGIEAAPYDINHWLDYDKTFTWGCYGLIIGGTSANVGDGQTNTNLILASCSTSEAANACDTFSYNGYTDWYLPSSGELELLANIYGVNGYGKLDVTNYWSSTEYSLDFAYRVYATQGLISVYEKYYQSSIRPFRTF